VIDAFNTRDAQKIPPLACQPLSEGDIQDLRDNMTKIPSGVVYAPAGAPQITGSTGELNLQITGGGKSQTVQVSISKSSGGTWCVVG
jgi:hypothetical protein